MNPGSALPALVDAAHIVGAGAWLGALPALALLLRSASTEEGADGRPYAVIATHRFSFWALFVMAVIIGTGVWNAWNEVGGVPGLVGTPYGRLVLLKTALLLPVLALAAWNRRSLLPRLGGDGATVGRPAMRSLAGFVAVEAVVGAALVVVAAALALTPPGAHTTPTWPFSFRVAPEVTWNFPGVKSRVFIGGQLALVGVLALIAGCLVKRWRALLLAGAGAPCRRRAGRPAPLAVDACRPPTCAPRFPTTLPRSRMASPSTGLTVPSATARRAAVTGGRRGAAPTPGGPDRAAHNDHTAGDMFWWLTVSASACRASPARCRPTVAGTSSTSSGRCPRRGA